MQSVGNPGTLDQDDCDSKTEAGVETSIDRKQNDQ
jgi:hypothetical protein